MVKLINHILDAMGKEHITESDLGVSTVNDVIS